MRMFTKIAATLATGALPVVLWAGAAGAQQSSETTVQSQQSQSTVSVAPTSLPNTSGTGGTLARTGAEDLLPLAIGGVALAGAVAVRGLRRRSVA